MVEAASIQAQDIVTKILGKLSKVTGWSGDRRFVTVLNQLRTPIEPWECL